MKRTSYFKNALWAFVVICANNPIYGSDLYVSLDGSNEIGMINDTGFYITVSSGFNHPSGLAFDNFGNLFVADYSAASIKKISLNGTVTTFASLTIPYSLAFDDGGNLYASHLGSSANPNYDTVSKILPDGTVSTFATGLSAPSGLSFDSEGNLYVANRGSNTISKVTPFGLVSTFATGLNLPTGLAFDDGGSLYVANFGDSTIRRIDPSGSMSTFVSSGLLNPIGLAFDQSQNLYVANYDGNTISKVSSAGIVSTFSSGLVSPAFLAFESLPVPEPGSLASVIFFLICAILGEFFIPLNC